MDFTLAQAVEHFWPVSVTGWLTLFIASGTIVGGFSALVWKVFKYLSTIQNELAPMEGKSLRTTVEDIDDRVRALETHHREQDIRREQSWLYRLLGD